MIPTIPRVRVVLAVLLALGGGYHRPIMTFGGTGSGPFTFQRTSGILVHSAGSTDGSDPSTKRPVIGELMAETGFYQSMTLSSDEEQPLYHTRSQYQDISIVKTDYYGKVLILDGVVQLTERDADSYNEMMAHIAMMATSEPKRVLVVGGGDGYVLSEVLKHESVVSVDHVDLDGEVIETCRKHFPWGKAWQDPRVNLHIADGAKFVANAKDGYYDAIIQDSSDPYTWSDDGKKLELPSNILYSEQHFRHILRILRPGGVFNFQAETFNIPSDLEGISEWRSQALDVGFFSARYGSLMISSYPTGQIGFLLCSKSDNKSSTDSAPTLKEVEERFAQMVRRGDRTTYYQPKLQFSSFDLPLWVEESIYGASIVSSVSGLEQEL